MTYEEMVLKHNELLAYIEAESNEYTTRMQPYQDAVKAILTAIQVKLQEEKLKNVKTEYGTPYLHTSTSVKVDNRDNFLQFIVKEGRWDMLDARALKAPVEAFVDTNAAPPPGIIVEGFISCRIRGKQQMEKS